MHSFFPVDVAVGPTWWQRCRLLADVDGDRVLLFTTFEGQPRLAAASTVPGGFVTTGFPYRIETVDGVWVMQQSGGCGCSSPLKRVSVADLLTLAAAGVPQ